MFWSTELLLEKAKFYAHKAEESLTDELRPLFASIAIEFLARSALAKVHPSLLADSREGKNILYSVGINVKPPVKSINMKTVLMRCEEIFKLDKELFNFAVTLMELRNSELHSGESAFLELPLNWEPQYYLLSNTFLKFGERELITVFPKDSLARIEKIVLEFNKAIDSTVKKKISTCQMHFSGLSSAQKELRIAAAENKIKELVKATRNSKVIKCPACTNKAFIRGEVTDFSDSKLVDTEIIYEKRILPDNLTCPSCDLELTSYNELASATVGDSFTVTEYEDPVEFFGIDPKEHLSESDIERLIEERSYDEYGDE